MPVRMNEIKPGMFFETDDFTVTAFSVTHRGPDCLGYVFEGKARRPFLAEKADELGVPFGPERRELVAGNEITLADGRHRQTGRCAGSTPKRRETGRCR